MNSVLRLTLQANTEQRARLLALQQLFAQACNHISPMVQKTRCWNRVALHHMAYKSLRQHFPSIGSQMACNAIYSVSRASRRVYQNPSSPFHIARLGDQPLPLLRFAPDAPVYFDRHTLSLREGEISMYTLDGRMRFQAGLSAEDEARFRTDRLREVALTLRSGDFELRFMFARLEGDDSGEADSPPDQADLPHYLLIDGAPAALAAPKPSSAPAQHSPAAP